MRLLIATFPQTARAKRTLVSSVNVMADGIVLPSGHVELSSTFRRMEPCGRFTTSVPVGDMITSYAYTSTMSQLTGDNLNDLRAFLRYEEHAGSDRASTQLATEEESNPFDEPGGQSETQSAVWSDVSFLQYSATFGSILHPLPQNTLFTTTTSGDLISKANTNLGSIIFVNETAGLRQFLATLSEKRSETHHVLKVQLIPSPWGTAEGLLPPVEMILSLDAESQIVRLKHLTAINTGCEAFVMLPDHAVDVKISRNHCQYLNNAGGLASINSFIETINKSAGGYGQITPPPSLALPAFGSNVSQASIQYLVKSVSHEESLTIRYSDSFRLVYSRVDATTATEAQEALSLRWNTNPNSTTTDVDLLLRQFITNTADITRNLTRGTVITKLPHRHLDKPLVHTYGNKASQPVGADIPLTAATC